MGAGNGVLTAGHCSIASGGDSATFRSVDGWAFLEYQAQSTWSVDAQSMEVVDGTTSPAIHLYNGVLRMISDGNFAPVIWNAVQLCESQ